MLLLPAIFSALAMAASIPKRDVTTTTLSTGVRFKAHVVSGPEELSQKVNNLYLNGIHVGAGYNIAGFTDFGTIFYQNASDETTGGTVLISSWPPLNINFIPQTSENSLVMISAGQPNVDVVVTEDNGALSLAPATWAACYEPLAYYDDEIYIVLKNYNVSTAVPDECAVLDVLPFCAELPPFPDQGESLNLEPQSISCYVDSA
ncbi:hypothetical protein Cpir12675_003555 [Ceratocystis pirilliformis]|uniref:DUF7907 domain-containing protein n=1 Tax=Ceratocystis pirilliformis TaxID=259994 RepID=A0ABR3Z587_9PEZI